MVPLAALAASRASAHAVALALRQRQDPEALPFVHKAWPSA